MSRIAPVPGEVELVVLGERHRTARVQHAHHGVAAAQDLHRVVAALPPGRDVLLDRVELPVGAVEDPSGTACRAARRRPSARRAAPTIRGRRCRAASAGRGTSPRRRSRPRLAGRRWGKPSCDQVSAMPPTVRMMPLGCSCWACAWSNDPRHGGAVERLQRISVLDQVGRRRGHDVEAGGAGAGAGDGARPLVGKLDGHGADPDAGLALEALVEVGLQATGPSGRRSWR